MDTTSWNDLVTEIVEIEEMISETGPGDDPDSAWALQLLRKKLARKRMSLSNMSVSKPV